MSILISESMIFLSSLFSEKLLKIELNFSSNFENFEFLANLVTLETSVCGDRNSRISFHLVAYSKH